MSTKTELVSVLQRNARNIRNICILAHVDHGKTTLADSLIASNGIISPRLAGKLRYLDSREDEQVRGITMKSSAISLYFKSEESQEYLINLIDSPGHVDFSSEVSTAVRLCDGAIVVIDVVEGVCPQTQAVLRQAWLERLKPILVFNKIDRLICELRLSPQEAAIHLQQLLEKVNAVTGSLFSAEVLEKLNKAEAPNGSEIHSDTEGSQTVYDWSAGLEFVDDSKLYFSPNDGNVVFASATDGWGFRIEQFSKIYAKKLGIQEDVLNKTLWGDHYANVKAKKILKGAQAKGKKSLFAQFVLENIWSLYDTVLTKRDKDKCDKIVQSLNISVSARDKRLISSEPKSYLKALCTQWIPLSSAVLSSVCDHLPSPLSISEDRVEGLMCGSTHSFEAFPKETKDLKQDFLSCDSSGKVIVLVSKMVAVDPSHLPQAKKRPLTTEEIQERREAARRKHMERQMQANPAEEKSKISDNADAEVTRDGAQGNREDETSSPHFVAFARVFSGTLKKGDKLFMLGPKHDPTQIWQDNLKEDVVNNISKYPHIAEVTVGDLYLLMGRELSSLEEVAPGNIVGIAGLEEQVLKSATLSTTIACPPFNPLSKDTSPIIRVAVEPKLLSQMSQLVEGLRLLNQADPSVRVLVQETGEHVIVTAGEVHLQRCLDDLQQRFAKIEINVSPPIVPFRETIIPRPKVDMLNELIGNQEKDLMQRYKVKEQDDLANDEEQSYQIKSKRRNYFERKGCVSVSTSGGECEFILRAVPLPEGVVLLLESNSDDLKILDSLDVEFRENFLRQIQVQECLSPASTCKSDVSQSIKNEIFVRIRELRGKLKREFEKTGKRTWADVIDNIWSFGPRRNGSNVLINAVKDYRRPSIWSVLLNCNSEFESYRDLDRSIVSGFQLATLAGPLCEEPLQGVAFFIEEWNYGGAAVENKTENLAAQSEEHPDFKRGFGKGSLSGQLISCMKDGFRSAFQNQPQRLMAAMYSCDIQATADVLGKVYAVVGKREGRVVKEEMKEGSDIFNIISTLPVAESFGFAEEIRKRTSGLASPQLMFSHWEVIQSDPFWVPTTEEEIQHYGEKADFENQAAKYMNAVRRRKGLFVEEKTVQHAEKQRTLTKNK